MTIKVTDINGKDFDINLDDHITYVNDDMSTSANKMFAGGTIADNATEGTQNKLTLEIVNASGEAFDITDEAMANEIVDIDVYIEATHSDMEINNGFYTGDSMQRDASSFTTPYKKPFIMNHDVHSEPVGRIIQSECVDSLVVDGSKAIDVVAKVSDKAAIEKFLDGRYSTVSIGARPSTVTCNHCGKHILKDGNFKFCGHMRGESYDNKKATWKIEDLEYSELSIVNAPADKMASVYRIKVNTKADLRTRNEDDTINSIVNIANSIDQDELEKESNVAEEGVLLVTDKEELDATISKLKETIGDMQDKAQALEDENKVLKIDNEFLFENIDRVCNMVISIVSKVLDATTKEEVSKDANEAMKQLENAISLIGKEDTDIEEKDEEEVVEEVVVVKKATDPTVTNEKDPCVVVEESNSLDTKETDNNKRKGYDSGNKMFDSIFALYK